MKAVYWTPEATQDRDYIYDRIEADNPAAATDLDELFEQKSTPLAAHPALGRLGGSVAKIVKLEHAWRRLDGRNDDGFQVAPFPG